MDNPAPGTPFVYETTERTLSLFAADFDDFATLTLNFTGRRPATLRDVTPALVVNTVSVYEDVIDRFGIERSTSPHLARTKRAIRHLRWLLLAHHLHRRHP